MSGTNPIRSSLQWAWGASLRSVRAWGVSAACGAGVSAWAAPAAAGGTGEYAGLVAGSQPEPATSDQDSPPAPQKLRALRLVAASPESIGRVRVGMPQTRTLHFQNVTSGPVALEVVNRSCSFLSVEVDAARIEPGQSAKVTMLIVPQATLGEQSQWATLRASWREGDEDVAERAMFGISYEPDRAFMMRPEEVFISAIAGRSGHADLFVRGLTPKDPGPDLRDPECTIPGWTARIVQDPSLPPSTGRVRVSGPVTTPGYLDGEIWCKTSNSVQASIRVPIRVSVLSPYRAFPGGAAFSRRAGDGERTITLKLIPRVGDGAPPARVEVSDTPEWLTVVFDGKDSVAVTLRPDGRMPEFGARRARVIATDGTELLDFPIAWFTHASSAAGAP